MSDVDKSGCAGFAFGAVVTFMLMGAALDHFVKGFVSKEEVIQHGAAYYHPETGDFTWKERAKDESSRNL